MKKAISKRNIKDEEIEVQIKLCIYKNPMNYGEHFFGTPKQADDRALEMIRSVNKILKADFSVEIETYDLKKVVYLDSESLFDNDFSEIGNTKDLPKIYNRVASIFKGSTNLRKISKNENSFLL